MLLNLILWPIHTSEKFKNTPRKMFSDTLQQCFTVLCLFIIVLFPNGLIENPTHFFFFLNQLIFHI